jgi:hypothetical protein
MLTRERLELRDHLAVAAELEVGLDPQIQRTEPKLFETGYSRLREVFVRELRKRRPTPELERFAQLLGSSLRGLLRRRRDELLEPAEVELLVIELERVSGCSGHQLRASWSERLPKLRNAHAQGGTPWIGRSRPPEQVSETVGRDNLVRMQREDREQRPLLRTADRNLALLVPDLQRPEDADIHP